MSTAEYVPESGSEYPVQTTITIQNTMIGHFTTSTLLHPRNHEPYAFVLFLNSPDQNSQDYITTRNSTRISSSLSSPTTSLAHPTSPASSSHIQTQSPETSGNYLTHISAHVYHIYHMTHLTHTYHIYLTHSSDI